jgi:LPS sulfotransferase NodH
MKNLLRDAFPTNSVLRASTCSAAAARSRLYVILLTPRSGSTWLTELLIGAGYLGAPQEWFNDGWIYSEEPALGCLPPKLRGLSDVNDYLDAIVDEGRGVAGLELSVFQAEMLGDLMDGPVDPNWLTAVFYLRRRDLFSQAVSLYRSVASGRFHSYQNSADQIEAFNSTPFDLEKLIEWLNFLILCEKKFAEAFERYRLRPIDLFYEDLVRDPLAMVQKIASAIGVEPPQSLAPASMSVLRDSTSADWRERLAQATPQATRDWIERGRFA